MPFKSQLKRNLKLCNDKILPAIEIIRYNSDFCSNSDNGNHQSRTWRVVTGNLILWRSQYFSKYWSLKACFDPKGFWRHIGFKRLQFPANFYLFKVSNRNIRKRCETCWKLTIKSPERCHWRIRTFNIFHSLLFCF